MIIYTATIKKGVVLNFVNKFDLRLDEELYLVKHGYDMNMKNGLKYQYQILNTSYVLDITEIDNLKECAKCEPEI